MGRVTEAYHGDGFSAQRVPGGALLVGPMRIVLEDSGEFEIPAGTIIDRPCDELGLVLPGELGQDWGPCFARVDIGVDSKVERVLILSYEYAPDIDLKRVSVSGTLLGATSDTGILYLDSRGEAIAWLLDPGTQFVCGNEMWEPPSFPQAQANLYYQFVLDLDSGTVVEATCQGGF